MTERTRNGRNIADLSLANNINERTMKASSLAAERQQPPPLASGSSSSSSNQQRRRELIINGHKALKGRYSYFSTLDHYCGGALVAPDTVLTAGHCLPKHKHSVQPHVGTYSFYHDKHDDDSAQVFDIIAMERHPRWRALGEDEFRHDVSLLFLNDTVHNIPYVQLNRNDSLPLPGQQVTAMGVGWTSPDWRYAKKAMILQEVHLNYLPNDQCELSSNKRHSTNDDNDDNDDDDDDEVISFEGRIHPDHMCTTGGPKNKRDACAYDSGSPIILEGDGPEEDILVGLVSWGEGCADKDFPAVNTRISDSLDFIERSVCEHSSHPPPEFNCFGNANTTLEPTTESPEPPLVEQPANSTTTIISAYQVWLIVACLVLAILYWIRQKGGASQSGGGEYDSIKWRPNHKHYKDKQYSSETEYLNRSYQSSPASSKASSNASGASSDDAIEISDV